MSASPVDRDRRARELSRYGTRGWYTDHLERSVKCGCTALAPDNTCDLGVVLFKLARSARAAEKHGTNT